MNCDKRRKTHFALEIKMALILILVLKIIAMVVGVVVTVIVKAIALKDYQKCRPHYYGNS